MTDNITLTIHAASMPELRAKLIAMFGDVFNEEPARPSSSSSSPYFDVDHAGDLDRCSAAHAARIEMMMANAEREPEPEPEPTPEPKPARQKKAQKSAPEPEAAPGPEPAPEAAPEPEIVTLDTCRDVLTRLQALSPERTAAVTGLMRRVAGKSRLTEIEESQWPALMAAARAEIAELEASV